MNKQQNTSLATDSGQPKVKGSVLSKIQQKIAASVLALLLPCSLMADPILVRINDRAFLPPEIEVFGAPAGYNIYTGENVNNFAVEDGALITLLGVDLAGAIPDQGWRYIDPKAPDPAHAAADIVWVEHDFDFFGTGDLRVGFNSHFPGGWYTTPPSPPIPGFDLNAGPVKAYWVTVYSSATLVVQFKGPIVPGR